MQIAKAQKRSIPLKSYQNERRSLNHGNDSVAKKRKTEAGWTTNGWRCQCGIENDGTKCSGCGKGLVQSALKSPVTVSAADATKDIRKRVLANEDAKSKAIREEALQQEHDESKQWRPGMSWTHSMQKLYCFRGRFHYSPSDSAMIAACEALQPLLTELQKETVHTSLVRDTARPVIAVRESFDLQKSLEELQYLENAWISDGRNLAKCEQASKQMRLSLLSECKGVIAFCSRCDPKLIPIPSKYTLCDNCLVATIPPTWRCNSDDQKQQDMFLQTLKRDRPALLRRLEVYNFGIESERECAMFVDRQRQRLSNHFLWIQQQLALVVPTDSS